MKKFLILLTLFSLFLSLATAQVIVNEPFDYNGGTLPTGWTTVSFFDGGPGPAPGQALWASTPDGTGSSGAYWENRPPILSPTGLSGAVIFNSDSLDSNGLPGQLCQGPACAAHSGALISPPYNLTGIPVVGLRFYQYLRSSQAITTVGISNDGGLIWNDIPINQSVADRPFGGESNPFSPVQLDITPWAANQAQVQIRFVFEGSYFFWIIDDLELLSTGGPDLALESIDWPGQRYTCLLDTAESIRVRVRNLSNQPVNNIPVSYRLDGGPPVQEFLPFSLQPNESVDYSFSTPANLRPDPANGHVLELNIPLPTDANPNNNQLSVELPPCEIGTDTLGGEYIAKRLIVQFAPGSSPTVKDSVRNLYSASLLESCACDSIELWAFSLPLMIGGQTLTGTEEVRTRVKDEADVEETDYDYLLKRVEPDSTNNPAKWSSGGGSIAQNDSVVVGLIDTGFDFGHDSLVGTYWRNGAELTNPFSPDDDANCYRYDHWGHHFLEPESVPADDNSHGTHVGGLILKNLPDSVKASIMPLKVQAQNGRGTLFHAICAMYYGAAEGADMLNMSLGFYGERPRVMDSAFARIGRVHDLLVVTSAGNQGFWLDTLPHWPSDFSLDYPQVISVAAVDPDDNLAPFSNYSLGVDLAAPGVDELGPVPGNMLQRKSGTSMAAGIVTRAAVLYLHCHPGAGGTEIKQALLNLAEVESSLLGLIKDSKRLNLVDGVYLDCGSIPIEEELKINPVSAAPNPFRESFQVSYMLDSPQALRWQVLNLQGKMMAAGEQKAGTGPQQIEIEAERWPGGVYVWQGRTEQDYWSVKIVKQ